MPYPAKLAKLDMSNRIAVLNTRNKGDWDPVSIGASVSLDGLVVGDYYSWSLDKGVVTAIERLPDRGPSGGGNGRTSGLSQSPTPPVYQSEDRKQQDIRLTMCGLANQWVAHHGSCPSGAEVYQIRLCAEELWNSAQTTAPGQQASYSASQGPQAPPSAGMPSDDPNDDIPF